MGISQVELKNKLQYDPLTGEFTRLPISNRGGPIGSVTGVRDPNGYIRISLFYKLYQAHRLAFLYMTGEFPPEDIDHIDCDKSSNKGSNLRACSRMENIHNTGIRCTNSSGVKGVSWHKRDKKWCVNMRINGKQRSLGSYDSLELAGLIATEARELYHGAYARHV